MEEISITIDNIDTKSTGLTALYTVPINKQLVMEKIVLRATESTGITSAAQGTVGSNNPDYNNLLPLGYKIFNGLKEINLMNISGIDDNFCYPIFQAGETIYLDIITASTGTSQTISADVFGYLI